MTHSLQHFAERLLFGDSVDDKLFFPSSISYDSFSAIPVPDQPTRPVGLDFSKERLPFPKDFSEAKERGMALQFFANHELLAIELMALCLLRFPNAPRKFQKGLVHIISEEQEHLRLYLKRSKELGVELGAVPMNSFFWDCLSGSDSEMDFITGMGMTFEQANLDHCIHYGRLFRAVEDHQTVSLLEQVYMDEIRHVRHGLHWFRQWKDPSQTDFYVHEDRLDLPMSVMRAKGLSFDRKGRRDIGFDEEYIQKLEFYSISKGRPSDVYVFRPNCELDQTGQEPKKIARKMQQSLAPLMLFLSKKDDIVISEPLSIEQLQEFQTIGIALPQFVPTYQSIKDRLLGKKKPWGWSQKIAKELNARYCSDWTALFGKSWGAKRLEEYIRDYGADYISDRDTIGKSLESLEQIEEHCQKLCEKGYSRMILKAEYGTAGRASKRVNYPLTETEKSWVLRIIRHQHRIVAEPELDKVLDFSIQIEVSEKGVKQIALGRFETDAQGQYLGHYLGRFQQDLNRELLRFLHGNGQDKLRFRRVQQQIVQIVGSSLQKAGYLGPAGIDCLIHRSASGDYQIRPIVEVNPRYTMGRIAHEISRYVHPRAQAFFAIQPRSKVQEREMKQTEGRWSSGTMILTQKDAPVVAVLDIRSN